MNQRKHIDARRSKKRIGRKKEAPTRISYEIAQALKKMQPDTPQGRRDAFIFCVALELGLRTSEISDLKVGDFNIDERTVTFYRRKVNKVQTHYLTDDLYEALHNYLPIAPQEPHVPILRASLKNGQLKWEGMTPTGISERIRKVGKAFGIERLSAHDLRHYWATRAASQGTGEFALQEAGGWNSLAMPRRYVEEAKIANSGVKL